MPSVTTTVGPLTLPIAAGAVGSSLDDHVVLCALDYLAHWLNQYLNAKLAQQTGTSFEAVPSGNKFPWDPSTYFVLGDNDGDTNPFPALYAWWEGRSQVVPERTSLLYDARARDIQIAYVFDELVAPGGLRSRNGLLNAVDATFHRALDRMAHPTFGYNGDPVGTPIWRSLSLAELRYLGSTQGRFEQQVPTSNPAPGGPGEGSVVRGFPMLRASLRVVETVNLDTTSEADEFADALFTISGSDGESKETTEIMQRYLLSPDGDQES